MDTQAGGLPEDQRDTAAESLSTGAEDEALPLGLIPGHLTVDQAAAKAGVTTKTIRRWLEGGSLPAQMVRRGKTRVLQISPADLEAAVKASGRRKVRSSPLPVLLEDTKLALQESRLRHEVELAELRAALALEQIKREEDRQRLALEAEEARKEATLQTAEVQKILSEVRQVLSESKAETHELKAQVSMLQDQVLRALPAPKAAEAPSIWQKIGRALGIGRR